MVIVLLLFYIFSFIDRQIIALLVQPIKRDLGVSDTQIGLLQGFASPSSTRYSAFRSAASPTA